MTSYSQYFALKGFSNLDGRRGGGRTGGRTAPTLAPTGTTASTPTTTTTPRTTTTTTPRTTTTTTPRTTRPIRIPMPYPVPIYGGGYPIIPVYLEEEKTPVVTVADVKESIKKEEAKKMIAPSPEGEGGGEKEKEKEITYIPIAVIAIGVLFLIFKPLKVK